MGDYGSIGEVGADSLAPCVWWRRNESQCSSVTSESRSYLAMDAKIIGTRPTIRDAIYALAPQGGRKEIIAALGRPITWGAIRHWMEGRKPIPQWAVERIQAQLAARSEVVAQAASAGHGAHCAAHWRAYHARRAREKDEQARKEKGTI